jgi:hypothetical protein
MTKKEFPPAKHMDGYNYEAGKDYCPECGTHFYEEEYDGKYKKVWHQEHTDDVGTYICRECKLKTKQAECVKCKKVMQKSDMKLVAFHSRKYICKECKFEEFFNNYKGKVCPILSSRIGVRTTCITTSCVAFVCNKDMPQVYCELINKESYQCPYY